MSVKDGFLKRWSRRKRSAVREAAPEATPAAPPPVAAAAGELPPLPPIESIEAGSDISAFLAPGVPTALSQAALRRAWSADPAIRDFIGLSENSWDFTAVGGVPGFGAIDPDSVQRLLDRVLGAPEPEVPAVANAAPEESAPAAAEPEAVASLAAPQDTPAPEPDAAPAFDKVNAAVRDEPSEGESGVATNRRRHGGALPD